MEDKTSYTYDKTYLHIITEYHLEINNYKHDKEANF